MDRKTYKVALDTLERLDQAVNKAIKQLEQIESEEGIGFDTTSTGSLV